MTLTGKRNLRRPGSLAAILVAAFLLSAGCERPVTSPELVIFATGSLFGQLHTCG